MCALLSHATFALGVVFYVGRYWSLSNVLAAKTTNLAEGDVVAAFARLNWLETAGGQSPPLPAAFAQPLSGLWVRVLAQGNTQSDCASPQWLAASGLGSGNWSLQPLPLQQQCPPLNEFVLGCPRCELKAQAGLQFTLAYSCQALVVEVLTAGPAPPNAMDLTVPRAALYTFSAANAQGNSSAFLSALDVTVDAVRGMVLDGKRGSLFNAVLGTSARTQELYSVSGKGYLILGGTSSPRFTLNVSGSGSTSTILPASSAILVSIAFNVDPAYSVVNISLQQPLVATLTAIIGLGTIYGIFSIAFHYLAKKCTKDSAPASNGRFNPAPASNGRFNPAFVDNPLGRMSRVARTGAPPSDRGALEISFFSTPASQAQRISALAPPQSSTSDTPGTQEVSILTTPISRERMMSYYRPPSPERMGAKAAAAAGALPPTGQQNRPPTQAAIEVASAAAAAAAAAAHAASASAAAAPSPQHTQRWIAGPSSGAARRG